MSNLIRHLTGQKRPFCGQIKNPRPGGTPYVPLSATWYKEAMLFVNADLLGKGSNMMSMIPSADPHLRKLVENIRIMIAVFVTVCAIASKNCSEIVFNEETNEWGHRMVPTVSMIPCRDPINKFVGYLISVAYSPDPKDEKGEGTDDDEEDDEENGSGRKKKKKKNPLRLPNNPETILTKKLITNELKLQQHLWNPNQSPAMRTVSSSTSSSSSASSSSSSIPLPSGATTTGSSILQESLPAIFNRMTIETWERESAIYMVKSKGNTADNSEDRKKVAKQYNFFKVFSAENACRAMTAAGAHPAYCDPEAYRGVTATGERFQMFPLDGITTSLIDSGNFEHWDKALMPTEPRRMVDADDAELKAGIAQYYTEGFNEEGEPNDPEKFAEIVEMVKKQIADNEPVASDSKDDYSLRSWEHVYKQEVDKVNKDAARKKSEAERLGHATPSKLVELMEEHTRELKELRYRGMESYIRRDVPTNNALSNAEVAFAQWKFDHVPPETATTSSPGVLELLEEVKKKVARLDYDRPPLEASILGRHTLNQRRREEKKQPNSEMKRSSSSSSSKPKVYKTLSMPYEPRFKGYNPTAQIIQNLVIDLEVLNQTHVNHILGLQLMCCVYSVAVSRKMRLNLLIHGKPGAGKSEGIKETHEWCIPGTSELVGRESEKSEMITNNKTLDFAVKLAEEACPIKWSIGNKFHSKNDQSAAGNANTSIASIHRQSLTAEYLTYKRNNGKDPTTGNFFTELIIILAACAHAAAGNFAKTDIPANMASRALMIFIDMIERADRTLAETSRDRISPKHPVLRLAARNRLRRNQLLVKKIMHFVNAGLVQMTTRASDDLVTWIQSSLIKRGLATAGDQRPVDRLRIVIKILICITAISHVFDTPNRLINNDHDHTMQDWFTFIDGVERFLVGEPQHVFIAMTLCCGEWETPVAIKMARFLHNEFMLNNLYFWRFQRDPSTDELPPDPTDRSLEGRSGHIKDVLRLTNFHQNQAYKDPDGCLRKDFFILAYKSDKVGVGGKRGYGSVYDNNSTPPMDTSTPAARRQRVITHDGRVVDPQSGNEIYSNFSYEQKQSDPMEHVFNRILTGLHRALTHITNRTVERDEIRSILEKWRNTEIDAVVEYPDAKGNIQHRMTKTHAFKYVSIDASQCAYIRISKDFLYAQLQSMVDGLLQQVANHPGFGLNRYIVAKISSQKQYLLSSILKEDVKRVEPVVFVNSEPNEFAFDLCTSASGGALGGGRLIDDSSSGEMTVRSYLQMKMIGRRKRFEFDKKNTIQKFAMKYHQASIGLMNGPLLDYNGTDIEPLLNDMDNWHCHPLVLAAPLGPGGKRFDVDYDSVDLYHDILNDDDGLRGVDAVHESMGFIEAFQSGNPQTWSTFTRNIPESPSSSSLSSIPTRTTSIAVSSSSETKTAQPPPPQRAQRQAQPKKKTNNKSPINAYSMGIVISDAEYRRRFINTEVNELPLPPSLQRDYDNDNSEADLDTPSLASFRATMGGSVTSLPCDQPRTYRSSLSSVPSSSSSSSAVHSSLVPPGLIPSSCSSSSLINDIYQTSDSSDLSDL